MYQMDQDEIQHLNNLRQIHNQQLQLLKLKAAEFGELYTPEYITSQIASLEKKIEKINAQLTTFKELDTTNREVETERSQFQPKSIGNYAPNAQGSNIINAQTVSGNTFIGTQNNYGNEQGSTLLKSLEENALFTWRRKLLFIQNQEAIAADPSIKFQLQEQIKECQDKIRELGG